MLQHIHNHMTQSYTTHYTAHMTMMHCSHDYDALLT